MQQPRRAWLGWRRGALLAVGVVQILLAAVQGLGLSVGLAHDHGMGGGHLLNESTAWSAALGAVMKAVAKGERVTLVGFGTFYANKRAARTGQNPRTGEKIRIAAAVVPKFTAGAAFKEAANKRRGSK